MIHCVMQVPSHSKLLPLHLMKLVQKMTCSTAQQLAVHLLPIMSSKFSKRYLHIDNVNLTLKVQLPMSL